MNDFFYVLEDTNKKCKVSSIKYKYKYPKQILYSGFANKIVVFKTQRNNLQCIGKDGVRRVSG